MPGCSTIIVQILIRRDAEVKFVSVHLAVCAIALSITSRRESDLGLGWQRFFPGTPLLYMAT
jgi:hypothetical protein